MDKIEKFKKKLNNNEYGIFLPPTSDKEGLDILIEHFLGDYYSVNPISREQFNTEAICMILEKYQKKEKISFKGIVRKIKGTRN